MRSGHPPPHKKVKFFIYDAILLKFETHFHTFTNANWDKNLEMGVPCPPSHPPLLKVKFFIHFVIFLEMWLELPFLCFAEKAV